MIRLKNEPSFIRLLRENKGIKAAVYIIILSFVVFFGLLIATWVMRYRSQRIYYGPKCVYTTLINMSEQTSHYSLLLLQRDYSDIEGKFMEPEILTFQYADANLEQKSFYVTIDTDYPSGIPEQYPPGVPDSGICVKAGGVSVYIKHYDSSSSWTGAVGVVEYGMSVYLDEYVNTDSSESALCASVQLAGIDEAFVYSTYFYSSSGPNSVSTNATGTSPSFFSDFSGSNNKIYISKVTTDSASYDPFQDFLKSKQFIRSTAGCSATNANCRCTDPGAKDLPSCNSAYIEGKGYLVYDNNGGTIGYSKNCSHAGVKNLQHPVTSSGTNSTGDGTKGTQAYSAMVPYGSTIERAITPYTNDPTNSILSGINSSTFGNTNFPENTNLANSYRKSFPSNFIFCGSGTSLGTSPFPSFKMTTGFAETSATGIATGTRNSTVANAGSTYQIGFQQ